jgi:Fe-S oxidoreductase
MKTHLDWSTYKDAGVGDAYADIPKHGGDFAKAVAVCINSRQCETHGKQLMCPSFRVSDNPHFSTGGRVKLLKAALSSNLVDAALADPVLAEAMDLCVGCKGCKRECEANVDMALIKAEYMAQRAARGQLSLRSRLFAHAPRWLHRARWLRHPIKWRNRSRWLARLSERLLGLAASRPLPEPVAEPFGAARPGSMAAAKSGTEVVLLVDSFTRYFEPEIAEAAIAVLEAGDYRVQVAEALPQDRAADRPLCCGRTYLAQGLIKEARAEVTRLAASLLLHLDAGRTLVGLEASCVLGLRDDALALGLGADVERVAKQILLFEEFLSREIANKQTALPLRSLAGAETLVHGHCHQKATGAMKSMRRVLKSIPDHDFTSIDASCCGMAGTFGLEAEHVRMATDMAEQGLLPTLRAKPKARVVANGFSCRQQIRGHGDQRPQHLAVLLRDCLMVDSATG